MFGPARFIPLSLSLGIAACATVPPAPTTATSQQTGPHAAIQSAPRPTVRPIPATGQIWFTPHPPGQDPPGAANPRTGELDYFDLFKADALWQRAASLVNVFKFYPQVIDRSSDDQLRGIVADLERRGIALALEVGPLRPSGCGIGIEGFNAAEGLHVAQRLKSVGATLRFAALDEPYYFGSLERAVNACHWSAERVAQEIAAWTLDMRAIFPDIVVGDIEPLNDPATVDKYIAWLDTYRAVSGANFPFFHLDTAWARPHWGQEAKTLEDAVHKRGIRFGMLYFGDDGSTDRRWVELAEERMGLYESLYGGHPDHAVIQSFHDRPHYALPESDPAAFSHIVLSYARDRTTITLGTSADAKGLAMQGRLSGQAAAIENAPVHMAVTQVDGPGRYSEYKYAGVVPTGVNRAIVGFRVNTECGCDGPNDVGLYSVGYLEDGDRTQRVPNHEFAQGLAGWGLWGRPAQLEPSDRGGRLLHIAASPGQLVGLNSTDFPVISGAGYAVTFAARVSPASLGSGYFTIIFLDGGEKSRQAFAFELPVTLVDAKTGASGAFDGVVAPPPPGRVRIEAIFAGDETHWPAFAVWANDGP